jgi:hypothetical protein
MFWLMRSNVANVVDSRVMPARPGNFSGPEASATRASSTCIVLVLLCFIMTFVDNLIGVIVIGLCGVVPLCFLVYCGVYWAYTDRKYAFASYKEDMRAIYNDIECQKLIKKYKIKSAPQ